MVIHAKNYFYKVMEGTVLLLVPLGSDVQGKEKKLEQLLEGPVGEGTAQLH